MRSAEDPIMSTGRRATIVVDYNLGEIRVYLMEPTQAAQDQADPVAAFRPTERLETVVKGLVLQGSGIRHTVQ
jgi:hypothetical protein